MKKPLFLAALLCGCMMASFAQAAAKEPGFKFANGWTLSPHLSLGAFWESNARDTYGDEKSGGGWRVQPTLSLSQSGRLSTVSINAFYTLERGFDSDDALDSDSYGASLGLTRQISKHYTFTGTASYSRSENDEFYGAGWDLNNPGLSRIDKDRSDHYNLNAALGYQNTRWQWSLGLGWARTRYLDGYSHKSDSYNLNALVGRALGPRTYWNFSFSTTWNKSEYSSSSADNAYYFMTGLSGDISQKLKYSVMGGIGIYDYEGEHGGETEFGPTYSASLAYKLNRTFALSLALSSQYEPEYSGNVKSYYVWSHRLSGAVNAQWTDKCSSRLNLSWSYEDHIGSGSGNSDYERVYYHMAFNTSYKVGTHASLYGTLSWRYDDYDSRSKDDLRFDVGVSYAF